MPTERVYKLFPVVIALLAIAAFIPALSNDFVDWDDRVNFVLNPNFRGLGWPQLKWMWTSNLMARYIPVTWMTFGLDYTLWGMEPFGYHLTNIVLHAANAVLFYFLSIAILRLTMPKSAVTIPMGALFAALFFAVHPLRAESVAWVTERRDEVSGFFYLLAILAHLRAARGGPDKPLHRKYYWITVACGALAILSKEIAVTLPLVLLVLDVYPLRRLGGRSRWLSAGYRTVWLEKIPLLALAAADSALALYSGHQEGMVVSTGVLGWFTRLAVTTYNLAFYLWKTVLPLHLAPFYPLTFHRVDPRGLPFQLSAIVVVLITAAAILFRRRFPALLAIWMAYAAVLLPVLGIVNAFKQIVADRYSYLACLGWELVAGAAFLALWNAAGGDRVVRAIVGVPALIVILGLAILNWKQVQIWRNAETLWTYAASVEPSFLALNSLGLVDAERGDFAGAVNHFRQSIALDPDYEVSRNNLGAALLNLGEYEAAAREFEAALRLKPNLAESQNSWGYALMMQGKPGEAIPHFQRALQIDPGLDSARRNLDRALEQKGR